MVYGVCKPVNDALIVEIFKSIDNTGNVESRCCVVEPTWKKNRNQILKGGTYKINKVEAIQSF